MSSKKLVEVGDTVRFSSLVKLQDGSVVQKSSVPITIEIGTGIIIKGLYNAILGIAEGEEKKFTVSPEEAYGLEDKNFFRSIPIELLEKSDIKPRVGMRIRTINGDCQVIGFSGKEVEVDYNHPLAGKTLIFDIKIEEIIKKEK
ncbi:MAG: FKBP-type peptidyl-prolyl cis-trans isomerase [Deltaproteobacteria bacterium]|nr:FKBP-type peptidyl-prolyl cis-trans isomerase [Deltaproteobacteria bacterium]